MLIVGVTATLVRQPHKGRHGDTWCFNLSPVISQLFPSGGHDFTSCISRAVCTIHITCQPAKSRGLDGYDGYDGHNLPARLWIAEDLLRGTLRLPYTSLFWNLPAVVGGFLSAHDSPPNDSTMPYLTWEGAAD